MTHRKYLSQILHLWKRPCVNICWFLCQYLTPGVIWGLYVHLRDTPDATRPFLVDITPSRVVFSAIFVPRGVCDNSEMCIRARSLVMRLLTQTGFLTSDLTCDPWKWTNTMSETEIEPSCAGIGQKLISVDQKSPTTMVTTFVTLWLRILRIFIIPDTWLCWTFFWECRSNGLSGRATGQTHLFRPSVYVFSRSVSFRVYFYVKLWCQ